MPALLRLQNKGITREQNKQIKKGERPDGFEKGSPKGAQKDCDARWTKKNNETHFGYKNHAKVDAKSKLIASYATTSASVYDSGVFEELLDEKDKAILSDSAHKSQANEEVFLKRNLEDFTMLKANRNSPLSDDDKIYNKKGQPHSSARRSCDWQNEIYGCRHVPPNRASKS